MILDTTGKRLKAFRKTLQMNQKELAEILNVEQALISMVENDKTEFAYWHMKKLKDTHSLNIDWLENGTGEMFTNIPDGVSLKQPEDLYTPKLTQTRVDRVLAVVDAVMKERGISSYDEFCLSNGLYQNYLYEFKSKRMNDPNKLIFEILYQKYHANLAYIFYNDREMFRPKAGELQVLTIAVDNNNNEIVKMVPAYAHAGYQKGFADPEYIGNLPDHDFYNDAEGTYRVFELKGDSMFPYLQEGDFVKVKYLAPVHWKDKLHINEIFIVVSKDGIVCKQLKAHDTKKGILTLHSFNDLYEDYTIALSEVLELWYYKGYYSRRNMRELS